MQALVGPNLPREALLCGHCFHKRCLRRHMIVQQIGSLWDVRCIVCRMSAVDIGYDGPDGPVIGQFGSLAYMAGYHSTNADVGEAAATTSGRLLGANANVAPSQDPPPAAPSFQHTPPTGSMPLFLLIRESYVPYNHQQISEMLTRMIRRENSSDDWVRFDLLIGDPRLVRFSPQDVIDTIQTEYDRRRGFRFGTYWEWEGNAVKDIYICMNDNFHRNRYGS